jgi:hypothetical protein
LQLFTAETMGQWQRVCGDASFRMGDGLRRAVAELCFGGQTEEHVRLASGWIRRRHQMSTGLILERLIRMVRPLRIVEKSPAIVYDRSAMDRLLAMFPNAMFLHLVRHPRGFAESVMKASRNAKQFGPVPRWLSELAEFPTDDMEDDGAAELGPDPQAAWYRLQRNIIDFLAQVPERQKLRMRGEDVFSDADPSLRTIAAWIGVRTDRAALDAMKHPERSPYARYGPPNARMGNDAFFLEDPTLRLPQRFDLSLEGPLGWRDDDRGFLPSVTALAREFGYR